MSSDTISSAAPTFNTQDESPSPQVPVVSKQNMPALQQRPSLSHRRTKQANLTQRNESSLSPNGEASLGQQNAVSERQTILEEHQGVCCRIISSRKTEFSGLISLGKWRQVAHNFMLLRGILANTGLPLSLYVFLSTHLSRHRAATESPRTIMRCSPTCRNRFPNGL